MEPWKKREGSELSKKVEVFAVNILQLIRSVRIYPSNHPNLAEAARNVLNSAPLNSTGSLTVGVTPNELIVSNEFIAGRASSLASMLHSRRVLQVFWSEDVTLEEVWAFARVMSIPRLEGEDLRRRLRSEVYGIDVELLNLDQIHSEITTAVKEKKSEEDQERQRREAWLSMMSHEAPPEELASAIATDEFWEAAKEEWMEMGQDDSEGFTELLLKMGERLEDALSLLPEEKRQSTLDYLAQMGKYLSVKDLLQIIGREDPKSERLGIGTASLLREIDGERFIDLLAGLAAMGDQGTRRFAEVYHRFSPNTETNELLSLVQSRLDPGKDRGFTVEVWKTVKDLILNLKENPFMDTEYSESLESMMDPSDPERSGEESHFLMEDPDEYLDRLILALAVEGERDRLFNRIRIRAQQLGPLRILSFIRLVDQTLPKLLDSDPNLVKDLFYDGLSAITKTSIVERQALINFTVNHEACLLDPALKALTEEKNISTRQFLINLLSCFSSAATPTFVLKSRIGPWHIARNLTIILGQQGFPQVVRPLQALSQHPHPKVKREAIRALKKVQNSLADMQRKKGKKSQTEPAFRETVIKGVR